jgi:hypothetical protein
LTSLTESFVLPLPCDEVWPLFTARGERSWVSGWEPSFPGEQDDRSPGTVFTTDHGGQVTTWIVTAAEPGRRIEYARVTPNDTAGTVVVTCRPLSDGDSEVTVTYKLTALTPEATAKLGTFANTYTHYVRSWRHEILKSITPGPA